MTNSSDMPEHDYLAAARTQMNAETPIERNPFKAGMAAGLAGSKGKIDAAWVDLNSSNQPAGQKPNRWGWKLLAGIVVVGLLVRMGSRPDEKDMTYEQRADYSRVSVARYCNDRAREMVKNPTSYDRGSNRIVRQGGEWVVSQNFRAMNGFGAMLDNYFVCKYDFMAKTISDFQLYEGNF
jgi:hypothetical protein